MVSAKAHGPNPFSVFGFAGRAAIPASVFSPKTAKTQNRYAKEKPRKLLACRVLRASRPVPALA
jgi:hypothetical protein